MSSHVIRIFKLETVTSLKGFTPRKYKTILKNESLDKFDLESRTNPGLKML